MLKISLRKRLVSALFMSIILSGFLSGCFTMLLTEDGLTTKTHRESQLVLNDTLIALGKPDAQTSELLGNPNALALFGTKNTYVLTRGGDALVKIAQAFKANTILNAEQLSISNDVKRLYLDKDTAWGQVEFVYQPVSVALPARVIEDKILKDLGFLLIDEQYKLKISVEAAVKPAIQLAQAQVPTFRKNRGLSFYEPSSETLVSKPKLGRILLMPLTVAADVVTSPIQLIGLGVLAYALKDMRIGF